MAEVVSMPKLGFDMAEGVLVRWVIAEGEDVERGQVLAEIETDKATVEVESAHTGVVHHHLVGEGDILPVGVPIAVIGEAGEEIDVESLVGQTGDVDASDQPGDEVPAPEAEAPAEVGSAAPAQAEAVPQGTDEYPDGAKASPLARRMAHDLNIKLSSIQGSGPGGRIIKKDIESYQAAPTVSDQPSTVAAPLFTHLGPPPADETIQLTKLRQAIGRRMVEAKQQLPHFYVTREFDMASVIAQRKEINAMLADSGEKLSVNDFIVKAAALALREFPNLNASLQGDSVLRHGQVNVGVAVAVEGGLLTVVNRDADRKSLRQISSETKTMVGRAREGKVRPNDIEGSTFSVSNLGMYDVDHFIAIINPPEAAILAVGSAQEVPVVLDGEIVPGLRMKATISVDHRVSDGAEAAKFMQALARYLEEPLRLLI
ncbi:MAG: 2-oxo acid dehydrogenase subunit E2 [Anaerolineales bacterium]|nr:2-oxo acid dehydrogenase subunit E2 [Anaerolineales bacterium]